MSEKDEEKNNKEDHGITDLLLAIEMYRESEEKYRTLFERESEAIFIYDPDTKEIFDANEATVHMYGYGKEELSGMSCLKFSTDAKTSISEINKIRDKGEVSVPYMFHRKKDGTVFPVEISGYKISIDGKDMRFAVSKDITKRVRVEDELRESERSLKEVERVASIGNWSWNVKTNAVVWSDNLCRIHGLTPGEFDGRFETAMSFIHPEDLPGIEETVQVQMEKKQSLTFNYRIITRNGDVRNFHSEQNIHFDGEGEIERVVGVIQDVTERLRLDEQLRQAQKMEAIGQLTGGVAHDFNNLIQVINGNTEIARDGIEADHPSSEPLEAIARAGERAATLVRQLMQFSRRQVMRLECLDINSAIYNVIEMLERVIGEHIQLEWLPGVLHGTIRADQAMIEQVLMNLCINALDAMPKGGTLTIATHETEIGVDNRTAYSEIEPGKYIQLSVSDTGYGMSRETQEHLFEPFFTTKGVGKGTGLGLATVYGIVKQHRGAIDVSSEPGRETTFRIYWPQNEDASVTSDDATTASTVTSGTETLLLAEDNEQVRQLARTILERVGYTVLTAEDGEEAVKFFEERGDEIDLVILDVVMPKINGQEVYERINSLRPYTRVLFASGYSEIDVHNHFMNGEQLTYIQKPFTRDALLRAVRAKLDERV